MHSGIFNGLVSHSRSAPKQHSFRYRMFMMYLDLEELDEVFAGRWLWSTRRFALARFKRENYFGDRAQPLDGSVRDLVESQTGKRPDGPIRLLTHLSYFGYSFNPISLYYCFDRDDERVDTVVAEVSNTPWGDRHCYVLSERVDSGGGTIHRYKTSKELHVSPFMDMNITYDWLLTTPQDTLVVRIDNYTEQQRFFNATLALRRQEISAASLARALLAFPAMSFKVIFAIHWQALRLRLKGCRVYPYASTTSSPQMSK